MTRVDVLPPLNPGRGFHGGMAEQGDLAWPLAMAEIMRATGHEAPAVRAFLDSASGKHFAVEVLLSDQFGPLDQAISAAVKVWMTWHINRQMSRYFGLDSGQTYLTGFVELAWSENQAKDEVAEASD